MKKTETEEPENKRTLVATQYSYDGGIVWEYHNVHIETKGQPPVFSATENKAVKHTAMMRIAILPVPPEGIKVGNFQIFTQKDLETIKNDPDLLWMLLDSLEWGEAFYPDDLEWSDFNFIQAD